MSLPQRWLGKRQNNAMNADFDQARVLAALAGQLDVETLKPKEREAFEDQWGETFEKFLSPKMIASMADLRKKGGSVGYDEAGNYVRGLPDGKTEIIRPASDIKK